MRHTEERAEYDTYDGAAFGALDPNVLQAAPAVDPVSENLGDDIADDISTTTTLQIGGSLTTSLQSVGDRDFFRVTLQAGHTYVFQMTTPNPSALDTYLELRDSGGNLIQQDDDSGILTNSVMVVRPASSGTYYVVGRSFESAQQPATTGAYTVSAAEIPQGSSTPSTIIDTGRPSYSWDEAAIQLTRNGYSWATSFGAPATVTYGFRATTGTGIPSESNGFQRFTTQQILATEYVLQVWASIANINLVRVGTGSSGEDAYSNNAAILFGNYTEEAPFEASGSAFLPTTGSQASNSVQGDVWINISTTSNSTPANDPAGLSGFFGTSALSTLFHEAGHALGLHHPADYNASSTQTFTYQNDSIYREDDNMFTVMSYFTPSNTGAVMNRWSQMPAIHDIAAIQRLYGVNMTTRAGDTIYGFNNNTGLTLYGPSPSSSMYFTIWDGGGNDTLDGSGYSTNSLIDLREEAFSSMGPANGIAGAGVYNVSIARGAVIENAIGGSGNDTLIGNSANNTLTGGDGNDLIRPGGGTDIVIAGNGNDIVEIVSGEFGVGETLNGGAGSDTLRCYGLVTDFRTGSISSFETIQFARLAGEATLNVMFNATQIGIGLSNALVLSGSAGQDSVQIFVAPGAAVDVSGWTFSFPAWGFDDYIVYVGDSGNETFVGFPGLDIFFGSPGNDVYDGRGAFDFAAYIFSPNAVTADLAIQGVAQVIGGNQGSDTFINLEGLAGSQLGDQLFGDAQNNIILGLGGNDLINGRGGDDDLRGGDGDDSLEGGAGADTLLGEAGADRFVYRQAAHGGDTIVDFVSGIDKIEISAAGFGGGLTAGGAVIVRSTQNQVTGAGGQFVYSTIDGDLFWDADGGGAGVAVLIAHLANFANLTAADFVVTSIAAASVEGGHTAEETMAAASDHFNFDDTGAAAEVCTATETMFADSEFTASTDADASLAHVLANDVFTGDSMDGRAVDQWLQHHLALEGALGVDSSFKFA
jgi:Ca2+-binding RTX toxin-like protein